MSIAVRSNDPAADKAVAAPAAEAAAPVTESATPAPTEATASELANAASGAAKSEEANTEGKPETETEVETDVGLEAGKKKGGFQRRIDKLTAKAADKDREIEYWREQALKAAKPNADATPAPQKSKDDAGKPKADNFETHADFVEALTDWKTDQKLKERDSKVEASRIESEGQKIARDYSERAAKFSATKPDFQDVLEEVDDVPLSPAVRDLFLTSENGPELAYELAKNKEEFIRINKLPVIAAAREIGKLEARLQKPSSETKEQKTTKAPAPIAPVGTGGNASVAKSLYDPNLSFADYERLRKEQNKKRRQG